EPRGRLGLGAKSRPIKGQGRVAAYQPLQRHLPPQARLPRPVDDTHAPAAQLLEELAATKTASGTAAGWLGRSPRCPDTRTRRPTRPPRGHEARRRGRGGAAQARPRREIGPAAVAR